MTSKAPYTYKELKKIPIKLLIELYKNKSERLYPFCLI